MRSPNGQSISPEIRESAHCFFSTILSFPPSVHWLRLSTYWSDALSATSISLLSNNERIHLGFPQQIAMRPGSWQWRQTTGFLAFGPFRFSLPLEQLNAVAASAGLAFNFLLEHAMPIIRLLDVWYIAMANCLFSSILSSYAHLYFLPAFLFCFSTFFQHSLILLACAPHSWIAPISWDSVSSPSTLILSFTQSRKMSGFLASLPTPKFSRVRTFVYLLRR